MTATPSNPHDIKGAFVQVDDAIVITKYNGVYKQVPLYSRGTTLFTKSGAGFVMLMVNGGTSSPNTKWDEIIGSDYFCDELGRLTSDSGKQKAAAAPEGESE